MPHASIIVPARNAEATLDATLRSLRAQSFADLEIIVVDDGSTDRTVRIGADHAGEDPRVQLVVQANRGPAAARNSGIRGARGAIVGFCDAGDLWRPHKLAAHVRHLAAAPAVGLSFSGSARIGGAGHAPGLVQRPRLAGIRPEHVFLSNPVGNGSTAVLRRAALDAIAWRPAGERLGDWWFDESFRQFEDLECWLRLALTTDWRIEGVPGALTAHRLPPAGPPAGPRRPPDGSLPPGNGWWQSSRRSHPRSSPVTPLPRVPISCAPLRGARSWPGTGARRCASPSRACASRANRCGASRRKP